LGKSPLAEIAMRSALRVWPQAFGIALGLLLAVYVPTFVLAAVLRLRIEHVVPLVIVVSAALAYGLMLALVRRGPLTLSDFGLRRPVMHGAVVAVTFSIAAVIIVTFLLNKVREPGPLAGTVLAPALAWLYFGLGAPAQEELIFRGLVQTMLSRSFADSAASTPYAGIAAMVVAAVLFGLVHLEVGLYTAAAALVLGVLAGELRRRSESLIPAVLTHAAFNIAGLLTGAP
jgi:membrane protease YdiL (CAAX protease family)